MTRMFSIIAWTGSAFLGTAIAAAQAAAFASGVIAYLLILNGKSVSARCIWGWIVSVTLLLAISVAGVILALGLRGRLPGTRPRH